MDPVAESLLTAQRKAEALFATVVERGMIWPGLTESELSLHIHELASAEFGLRRMWHKRIARSVLCVTPVRGRKPPAPRCFSCSRSASGARRRK